MDTKPSSTPLWRQDESLREVEKILAANAGIRVVSFDFFDTLVSRLCAEPQDLFIEVGRRLSQQNLLLSSLSPSEFRAVRIAADEQARTKAAKSGRCSEVTLSAIYAELKKVVRDGKAAAGIEFEVERQFCYLNPATASLVGHVRSLGLRTAILSDTYFSTAQLTQLLVENGFTADHFDEILASCERGRSKHGGHLYNSLLRRFEIDSSELLHIGDNPISDIEMAHKLGVRTLHYYRTTPALEAVFKSERTLRGANIHPAGALNSMRVMAARRAHDRQDPFRDGAMVFGPLLSRFADWSVQRFAAAGARKVLALMREGEVLGELLKNAAAAAGIPLEIVPCHVSRLATGRASMTEVDAHSAALLLDGCPGVTTGAVLEILGLGEEAKKSMGAEKSAAVLSSPKSIADFLQLIFNQPGLRGQIQSRHEECFRLAFDYLTNLTAGEGNIGVIDLGWSGSIQRNIASILRRGGRDIRTVGCYLACTERAGRVALAGDSIHAYMEEDWWRATVLPETAISACIGSTIGYARGRDGKVVPVLGPEEFSPAEREMRGRVRQGILAFQAQWLSYCSRKGWKNLSTEILADIDGHAASILHRLLDFPGKAEAERLGRLQHSENYFYKVNHQPLCEDNATTLLRGMGITSLYQNVHYWPQGVVGLNYPRLISALRSGWSSPLALGRLGTAHGVTPTNATITDAELSALPGVIRALSPTQIIYCGPLTAGAAEIFHALLQKNGPLPGIPGRPRLIVLGKSHDPRWKQEFGDDLSIVDGDPADATTLRSVVTQLSPLGDAALVLADESEPSYLRPLLNGLAPFLGAKAIIMGACGRYDRETVEDDSPLAASLFKWYKSTGTEIGYSGWAEPVELRELVRNWIVLLRLPRINVWNRQWMFYAADAAPQPELLLN